MIRIILEGDAFTDTQYTNKILNIIKNDKNISEVDYNADGIFKLNKQTLCDTGQFPKCGYYFEPLDKYIVPIPIGSQYVIKHTDGRNGYDAHGIVIRFNKAINRSNFDNNFILDFVKEMHYCRNLDKCEIIEKTSEFGETDGTIVILYQSNEIKRIIFYLINDNDPNDENLYNIACEYFL